MGNAITRDDDHTFYQRGEEKYPPVTDVLKELEQDTTGLDIWRGINDGVGDAAHHAHLLWFARNRGTLAHYEALNPLADGDLWSNEEASSMEQVLTGPDEAAKKELHAEGASTHMADIVYSVMVNHDTVYADNRLDYTANTTLSSILWDDLEYFYDTFQALRFALGITEDNIIAVEQYLVDDCHGYGGQADLIYEDPQGNNVLLDLKTSSSLRQKHRLQSAAYKHGSETCDTVPVDTIDRMEVLRIAPHKREYRVHGSSQPEHIPDDAEWYDTEQFYSDKYGDFEYDGFEELWAHFESLARQANGGKGADYYSGDDEI